MNRLERRVAIVTGAARGQGAATARLFAEEGALVYLLDLLEEEAEAVAQSIGERAVFRLLDVRREAEWSAHVSEIIARHDRIDVLINNAGLNYHAPVEDTPKADFEKIIAINVVGPFLGIRCVVEQMKRQRRGSIVNISSVNGLRSNNDMCAYDTSKWALRGLTRSLSLELGAYGIRVNSIHPGAIDTAMINPTGDLDGPTLARNLGIPAGRVGQPIEVARARLFLASDEASYVSGAELAVDAGWTAGQLVDWKRIGFG